MLDARAHRLLLKLQSFPFDEPGASRPFSARLREENGWSEDLASRAIDEYRRFLVLAAFAGHRVSPSHIVDEVWHLHLLYTRSYWDELCGKVLGFSLHHEPSRGGTDSAALAADYMRTLSSYERLFNEAPPRDLWPSPNTAFSHHPKATSPKLSTFFGVAAVATPFSLPMVADVPGPLSMTGPAFLLLYLFAAPASALLAVAMRRTLCDAQSHEFALSLPFGSADIAYLRGGPTHAVDVTLVDLIVQRRLRFAAATNRIEPDSSDAPLEEAGYRVEARIAKPSPFEDAMLKRVGSGVALAKLRNDAAEDAKSFVGAHLVTKGLVHDEHRARPMFWLPMATALVFPVIGVLRIVMGVLHDRPVELLVVLSIVWGVVLYAFFRDALFTRPHLTNHGAERLRTLEMQHQAFIREAPHKDLPIATALFGVGVLPGGQLMDLGIALRRMGSSVRPISNGDDGTNADGGAAGSCGGADGGDGGGGCGGD